MHEEQYRATNRTTTTLTLAVVGFVALVGAGMWLAVYSTRYVPVVMNTVGSAAVSLSSIFIPASAPSLSVVSTPIAPSTISQSMGSSIIPTIDGGTAAAPAPSSVVKKSIPTAGKKTNNVVQIGGATTTTIHSNTGLPDFIVVIKAVGYLNSISADSFAASSTVPVGLRPAVNFTIKNIGTNTTGPWCFSASIPTSSHSLYESVPQQELNPGDYIDYTLGFDQANKGTDQMISITANITDTANTATCAHAVTESNPNNNSASAKITIIGG